MVRLADMWSQIYLTSDSAIPLYKQLFEQIRDKILVGELSTGSRIPATRELAGLIGLNRTTVSAAYDLLEREGLIRAHVGRGSFVERPARAMAVEELSVPVPTVSTEFISFATSRPAAELFPIEECRQTIIDVASGGDLGRILQLGSPLGFEPLREYLRGELRTTGVHDAGDDLMITSGCQQGQDLLIRTLVQPGDLVLLEDPVYPGLREMLHRAGARLAGFPVTAAGLDLSEVNRVLQRERARLIFVTPTFQNPTGATLPRAARAELIRLASARGVTIVENDVYSALRYEGEPIPSVKELASGGEVIQLGSFSKVAFPGLRVGWIVGSRQIVESCAAGKQWMDLHSDHLSQAVLLRFAESGRLAAHRKRVVAAGAEKLAAALKACDRHLPEGSQFTRPSGGMNLWVRLPHPLDASALLRAAEEQGVSYLPGRHFAVGRQEPGSLRLSFAGLEASRIEAGISILGALFTQELRRERLGGIARQVTAMV
jgi:2-aminoadipate transaminase